METEMQKQRPIEREQQLEVKARELSQLESRLAENYGIDGFIPSSLDDTQVKTRIYKIVHDKKPKLENEVISILEYALGERRNEAMMLGQYASKIESGKLDISKLKLETIAPTSGRIFDFADYIAHLRVSGTDKDFETFERYIICRSDGRIIQVRPYIEEPIAVQIPEKVSSERLTYSFSKSMRHDCNVDAAVAHISTLLENYSSELVSKKITAIRGLDSGVLGTIIARDISALNQIKQAVEDILSKA